MKRYLVGILILISIAAVITGTIWFSRAKETGLTKQRSELPKMQLIKTAYPQLRDFKQIRRWLGKAQAEVKIRLMALSDGTITYIAQKDEQAIKKGELLFRIGGTTVRRQLAFLETKISALKQKLAIATKTLKIKKRAIKEGLARADELSAAQSSLITAKTDLKDAQTKLSMLLQSLSIHSPISGVFTNRRVNIGQRVARGTELAQVIEPHRIRVVAKIFSAHPESLVGKHTAVHTQDGRQLTGTITKVLPKYDPSGAALLWIEGPELDANLKPGQMVDGAVLVTVHKSAICVPRSAIVYDEGEHPYVFVKRPNGYEKRAVRTGLSSGQWIEIVSGLTTQDEVVTQGGYELFYREFKKIYKVAD